MGILTWSEVRPPVCERGGRLEWFWRVRLGTLASGRDGGRGDVSLTHWCPACCSERGICAIYGSTTTTIISQKKPTGDELKCLLKEGSGHIFESYVHLTHTQSSPYMCMCACSDSAMHLLSCTWCLPSFVSPSSWTMMPPCILVQHNSMYCHINGWVYFERKAPFAKTSLKKGWWAYFRGWA